MRPLSAANRPSGPLLAGALALPLLATSCIQGRRPIVLDSTPAGALVLVDGIDSGHSTPCTIQLSNRRRTLEFQLEGYATEARDIRTGERSRVVYWRDGVVDMSTWPFPLWLGSEDFFFPIKEDDGEMPSRIHVRLVRQREPIADAR